MRVPSPLTADYIQIGVLSVLVVFGVPINIYSLVSDYPKVIKFLRRTFSNNRRESLSPILAVRQIPKNSCRKIFLLLKWQLVIANLLIFCVYCLPLIGWLITYRWLAGNLMCKGLFNNLRNVRPQSILRNASCIARGYTILIFVIDFGLYSRLF